MKYKVTLNGKTYEVEVEAGQAMLVDEYAAFAPAAAPVAAAPAVAAPAAAPVPAAAAASGAGETISAPMPGNVLRIEVTPGAKVKKGQTLLVLEAMKMENEIVAPYDGTVAQVVTSKGAVVDTGAPLIVLSNGAYTPAPAAAPAPVAAPAPAPAAAPAPAPAAPAVTAAGETISAPMPGNILRIEVTQGAAVKKGQTLLVLEAMKMENEIVAPRDGTVAQIVTSKGAVVDTGAPLIVLA